MIESVNIFQIFPRFILNDRDGFAMCRALEAGLNYFLEKCSEALDITINPAEMPEWRLDEMAWELNCLYDYDADIDVKRDWISDAYKNYRIHGTAEGVRQYIRRYFGECSVKEYFEFNGNPGQFNINVTGAQSTEAETWIRKACAKAKNVRSELNQIIYSGVEISMTQLAGTACAGIHLTIDCKML